MHKNSKETKTNKNGQISQTKRQRNQRRSSAVTTLIALSSWTFLKATSHYMTSHTVTFAHRGIYECVSFSVTVWKLYLFGCCLFHQSGNEPSEMHWNSAFNLPTSHHNPNVFFFLPTDRIKGRPAYPPDVPSTRTRTIYTILFLNRFSCFIYADRASTRTRKKLFY